MTPVIYLIGQATQALALDASTAIPIGVAISVGVFVVGITLKIYHSIRNHSEATNKKLAEIDYSLRGLRDSVRETWSRKDQEIWSLRLQIENEKLQLKVPEVRTIGMEPKPRKDS